MERKNTNSDKVYRKELELATLLSEVGGETKIYKASKLALNNVNRDRRHGLSPRSRSRQWSIFCLSCLGTLSGEVIGTHAFLCRTNLMVIVQILKLLDDPEMKDKRIVMVGVEEKLGLDSIQQFYAQWCNVKKKRVGCVNQGCCSIERKFRTGACCGTNCILCSALRLAGKHTYVRVM